MIKNSLSLKNTKDKINSYFNKVVDIKVNLGRNKIVKFKGKITNVYDALFTISPMEEYNGKTAFSYFEYMCGVVNINEKNIK